MSIEIISVEFKIGEKFVKLEAKELKRFLAGAFQESIYPYYPTFPYEGYYIPWQTSPSIPNSWDGTTADSWYKKSSDGTLMLT